MGRNARHPWKRFLKWAARRQRKADKEQLRKDPEQIPPRRVVKPENPRNWD